MKNIILCLALSFSDVLMSLKIWRKCFKNEPSPNRKIVKNESIFKGKEVTVHGKVEKICVKKGCWLNLGKGNQTVRVTFKNYGIFVPSTFLGKEVAIKGVFNLTEESVESVVT